MKTCSTLATLLGVIASTAVFAQASDVVPSPTTPSSHHHRSAAKTPASETPAAVDGTSPSDASTPAQKHVLKKHKHKHNAKPSKDAAAMDTTSPPIP